MKKPVLAAAAAVLMSTTLAACGWTDRPAPSTATGIVDSTALPRLQTSPDVLAVIDGDTVSAKQFVEMAGRSNLYEIEAGMLAQQKAQDPQLKAYGEQMVREHTEMGLAMNSKAAVAGPQFTSPATLDSKHQAMIDQLNAASGAQFDMLYIEQMRQSHKDTYELFNAMADRGSDSNFNEFAADYKQPVLDHLEHIDAIALKTMPASSTMSM